MLQPDVEGLTENAHILNRLKAVVGVEWDGNLKASTGVKRSAAEGGGAGAVSKRSKASASAESSGVDIQFLKESATEESVCDPEKLFFVLQ